nr:phospholipase A2-like protein [Maruca vitrata]
MNSHNILFLVSVLCVSAKGWVLTDVNFDELRRQQEVSLNEIHYNLPPNDTKHLKFNLIYPGTKWCGPGNVASNLDDLGIEKAADMCCRDHDNCPDILFAGETKRNLTNHAFYTRLSCECDEQFRKCLHNARSNVAEQIGTIYFNALGTQCFREDYPATGCEERGGWFRNKCVVYTYDKAGNKTVQWFDVPNF